MDCMGHWIFTIQGYTDFCLWSTREGLKRRVEEKIWPIGERTQNRKRIRRGDRLVFYLCGEGEHKFVGTAVLDSDVIEIGSSYNSNTLGLARYFVRLKQIRLWKTEVPINCVLTKLAAIPNAKHYGIYLQGGIRKLKPEDYELLVSLGSSH